MAQSVFQDAEAWVVRELRPGAGEGLQGAFIVADSLQIVDTRQPPKARETPALGGAEALQPFDRFLQPGHRRICRADRFPDRERFLNAALLLMPCGASGDFPNLDFAGESDENRVLRMAFRPFAGDGRGFGDPAGAKMLARLG